MINFGIGHLAIVSIKDLSLDRCSTFWADHYSGYNGIRRFVAMVMGI